MTEEKTTGFSVQEIMDEVAAEQAPPAETPVQDPKAKEPDQSDPPAKEPAQEASPPDPDKDPEPKPEPEPKPVPNPNHNLEQENFQLKQGFQQVQRVVEDYINDPELYRKERIKRGLEPVTKPEEPADIEIKVDPNMSTEDFLKEVKRVAVEAIKRDRVSTRAELDSLIKEAKSTINSEASKTLQPHYAERWKTAVKDLSDNYGTAFKEVEAELRSSILQDPSMADIRSAYSSKRISEKEALDNAFKAKYEDRWLDHKISQRLAKTKKEEEAKTEPKSKKRTKKSEPKPAKSDPEEKVGTSMTLDILNETNEELQP